MTGFTERRAFTTEAMQGRLSWQAWRERVGEFFFKVEIRPGVRDGAVGALAQRGFADTAVSGVSASAQRVTRNRQLALDDGIENYCFVFPTVGTFDLRHRGREQKVGTGGLCLIDATEAFEADVADGSKCICLSLPGELVRDRVRGIDDLCGRSDFADPVLASTLRHLAINALDIAPTVDADHLQDLCLNLIDMMILPKDERRVDGRRYADVVASCLMGKVRRVIRARLPDPAFDVAAAASACGVSTRQLQHALKMENSTFGRELMDARLFASAQMLRSKDPVPRQIGDVAVACGFASQAHFATRFKERFGHSPRDERERP